jgi:hypothetical protein
MNGGACFKFPSTLTPLYIRFSVRHMQYCVFVSAFFNLSLVVCVVFPAGQLRYCVFVIALFKLAKFLE